MEQAWGPSLICGSTTPTVIGRYQGHVPTVAFSFGAPYGTTTLKYFQDHRNAAMEKSHTPFSQGGHFPTIFSTNPNLLLMERASTRDRWLHKPSYTRFNLDSHRSTELTNFYQVSCVGLPCGLPSCPPAPPPWEGSDGQGPGGDLAPATVS